MKARYILSALAILLLPIASSAQEQATIVGTVTDPEGAFVPGANITISNGAIGFTHRHVSNSAGEYTAADIPIGEYKGRSASHRVPRTCAERASGKILKIEG